MNNPNVIDFVRVANQRISNATVQTMENNRREYDQHLSDFYLTRDREDVAYLGLLYSTFMSRMAGCAATTQSGGISYVFGSHVAAEPATRHEPNSVSFSWLDKGTDVSIPISRMMVLYERRLGVLATPATADAVDWSEVDVSVSNAFIRCLERVKDSRSTHSTALLQFFVPLITATRTLYAPSTEEIYGGNLQWVTDPTQPLNPERRFVMAACQFDPDGVMDLTFSQIGTDDITLVVLVQFNLANYRRMSESILHDEKIRRR